MNENKRELGNKAEEITQIANNDWPTLNEVSRTPFVVKSRKKVADIESINEDIQKNSAQEDHNISESNKQSEFVATQKPAVKETIEEIHRNPIVQKNDETIEQQINSVHNKNSTTRIDSKKVEEKVTVIKQVGIGLTHLFIINATSLLKPMNFVVQNFSKILMALIHLTVPLLMTWWFTTKVDFIASQLQKETSTMYYVYGAVFYLASAFLWIVFQVLAKGIYVSFKNSLKEVAEIGKNKN